MVMYVVLITLIIVLIMALIGILIYIRNISRKSDHELIKAKQELESVLKASKTENIIQVQAVELDYRKKLELLEAIKSEKALQTQVIEIEHKRKTEALLELDTKINEKSEHIKSLEDDYAKLLNQKKSSEVRLGKIAENMAPFFTCWPYDPNTFRFLGNPVDGIQFTDDEIIFVEIKTGKARLSDSQKWIKKLVQEKKVSFVSFKIGENGVALEKEE